MSIEISRYKPPHIHENASPPPTAIERLRAKLLDQWNITLLVDVGANTGQYALSIRKNGYKGKLVSFEPIPNVYRQLRDNARNDSNWECRQLALGKTPADSHIYVAGNNGESSSLLPMLDRHVQAAPNAAFVGTETVSIITLDSLQSELILSADRIWLKIDVQGTELDVLRGAASTLKFVSVIELELSLVPLYSGQPLIEDTIANLRCLGYVLIGTEVVFEDPHNGYALQLSGIFIKL